MSEASSAKTFRLISHILLIGIGHSHLDWKARHGRVKHEAVGEENTGGVKHEPRTGRIVIAICGWVASEARRTERVEFVSK